MEKGALLRGGAAAAVALGIAVLVERVVKATNGNTETPPTRGGWTELSPEDIEKY